MKPIPKSLSDKLEFFEGQIEYIRKSSIGTPKKLRIDLSVAHNDLRMPLTGNFFYIITSNTILDTVDIKVNEQREPAFSYSRGIGLLTPFYCLYFTNAAQPNAYVEILYGTQAPDFLQVIDNRSASDLAALMQEKVDIETGAKGTQTSKNAIANNNTVIIHTVTAGKTFHLSAAHLAKSTLLAGDCTIHVRDGGDVLQYEIITMMNVAVYPLSGNVCPHYPYLIPAGYDICVHSSAVFPAGATIHGWED